jgi:hypothetical protein
MPDERVPVPMTDMVSATVRHYPTEFEAMTAADMQPYVTFHMAPQRYGTVTTRLFQSSRP